MTDRELLELAKESGAWTPMTLPIDWNAGDLVFSSDELRKFAALVRRDERIACIEAIESKRRRYLDVGEYLTVDEALDAIRALAAQEADK